MRDARNTREDTVRERRGRRRKPQHEWLEAEQSAGPFASPRRGRRIYEDEVERSEPPAGMGPAGGAPMLTLPTLPAIPGVKPTPSGRRETSRQHALPPRGNEGGWDEPGPMARTYAADRSDQRERERTVARPLAVVHVSSIDDELLLPERLPVDSMPELAAYQPKHAMRRPRVDTRMLMRKARSPWNVTRTLFAIFVISLTFWTSLAAAGEPSQPLMTFEAMAGNHAARSVASLVQAETQGTRPDLYDSTAQFNDWWNAACSAAVMSEVLTAWGASRATIGRMIDVMQPDISLNGGLLRPEGFQRGAAAFGYRADINHHLTYKQMLYLTNVLGLPVIVNVRISYGYYHFFDGGHFLVMTGGDDQGLAIVDSSEYYIKYLPVDTFYSMFTGETVVVVPQDYQYTLPS